MQLKLLTGYDDAVVLHSNTEPGSIPAIHSNLELQDNMKERIFQVQTEYCSNN